MMDPADTLYQPAKDIVVQLREQGFVALWAGGCVRDHLLGRPPKDIDIATSARPETIEALFPHTHAVGKAFGVIAVHHHGHTFEVATFRQDVAYTDGRRPDAVHFTDPREDARRRDFTINALFYDPVTDTVIDYVGGRDDLAAKRIRAVGQPEQRFAEDHLRMLRAIRFAGMLDFTIDPATWQAIQAQAPNVGRISQERIRDELERMWTESQHPGQMLGWLRDSGLLAEVLPEVAAMHGVEQPPEFHPEGDVFAHTQLMFDLLEPPPRHRDLCWAVLLHDVGKPPTQSLGPGANGEERIRFDGHDRVGAEMAQRILERLRLPNAAIDRITHIVRNHMRFMHVQEMRKAKLRALIGAPTFPLELELHRVDCLSSHRKLDNYHFIQQVAADLAAEPVLPTAWIRGEDLIAIGLKPGPQIGHWLKEAYARQLDGDVSDRSQLLAWLEDQIRNPPE